MNIHNKLRSIGFKRSNTKFYERQNGEWVPEKEENVFAPRQFRFTHTYIYILGKNNHFVLCNIRRDDYIVIDLYADLRSQLYAGKVTGLKSKKQIINMFPKMERRDMILAELFK